MRGASTLLAALFVLLLAAIEAGGSTPATAAGGSEPVAEGAELFARHCSVCHGSTGRGDGPAAARFESPPANLTDGLTKFRSTGQETPPLRSDLERTIREGSRGTAMVEWASFLDPAQIESLASFVFTLEGYAAIEAAPPPIDGLSSTSTGAATTPVEPPESRQSGAEDGAALYARLGCAQCHGEDRRGNGPAAAGLVDRSGRRLPMPDLTLLPYKRGLDPEETAKTLLHGMDGTPMAAFEGAIAPEQALALARWLVETAIVERRGFIGEERLGFMTAMHEGGRCGMGGHGGGHGMGGHRGGHGMGGGMGGRMGRETTGRPMGHGGMACAGAAHHGAGGRGMTGDGGDASGHAAGGTGAGGPSSLRSCGAGARWLRALSARLAVTNDHKMKTVGSRELETRLGTYLRLVRDGLTIV